VRVSQRLLARVYAVPARSGGAASARSGGAVPVRSGGAVLVRSEDVTAGSRRRRIVRTSHRALRVRCGVTHAE